jgi:hypothetical protein
MAGAVDVLNGKRDHIEPYRLLEELVRLIPDGCVTSDVAGNLPDDYHHFITVYFQRDKNENQGGK